MVYLTSPEEQKRRAIAGSFNPTIPALFEDADIRKAAPFIGELLTVFTTPVIYLYMDRLGAWLRGGRRTPAAAALPADALRDPAE